MDIKKIIKRMEQSWREALDPRSVAKKDFEAGYVRDPIHGHVKLAPEDFFIIDIPPFQRLRSVSQLSFVNRLYPGANHTRFEHCLGAAHLAQKTMENLRDKQDAQELREIDETDIWTVKIAAYLHDIGHLPFSHAVEPVFESVIPGSDDDRTPHEKIGFEMIMTKYFAEVFRRMNHEFHNLDLDEKRIAILSTGSKKEVDDSDLFMYEIIHGEPVDCDRLDYLLRDAYYCGVPHGEVDVERLVETFTLIARRDGVHLAIDESGLFALEAMAVSRSTMYGAVYGHHTSRKAEGMILRALHHQQEEHRQTLESMLGKTDDFVIELLSKGCRIAKTIVDGLLYRRFFKGVFDVKISKICNLSPNMDYSVPLAKYGDSFSKINHEFRTWAKRIEFEESCLARRTDAGLVMVDCPRLRLPEPPTIDKYTPIRLRDGSDRSVVQLSPIVHALERERDSYATSILCAASSTIDGKAFGERVKKAFSGRYGLVI